MSALQSKPIPATPLSPATTERTAFYLESQGQSLFAWWHRPAGLQPTHGILLCPPIGHENIHAHRAMRHLAQKLASAGFGVLRLDYHGVGDSDGTDADPQRVATWLANVGDAASWLRESTGCEKVSLIGVRFGATLAALYAQDHEVENLVMWAPIVSGKRYVRELKALSQAARLTANTGSEALEAVGCVYTQEALQAFSQIDLRQLDLRYHQGLIVTSDLAPADDSLVNHLSSKGGTIQQVAQPGYEAMMAEPHATEVPHAALDFITTWFGDSGQPRAATGLALGNQSMPVQNSAGLRETIHSIGSQNELFGITTASVNVRPELPWIVILNGGSAHRVGSGRMHVQLARQFAALGFPSLRVDLGGLGDSLAESEAIENNSYASTAFRDVSAVCEYLTNLQPDRRIVLLGLCSGAYAAFQSAVQLPHPALLEAMLLNPLTFYWKDGMSIDDAPLDPLRVWHFYSSRIFNLTSWYRLLGGKTTLGITGVLRQLAGKVLGAYGTVKRAPKAVEPTPTEIYGHPKENNLSADLARLATAGRKLSMFVAESDPGHFLLMKLARRRATQMIREGQLSCFTISEADHIFSTDTSRRNLATVLVQYLNKRFPSQS